MIRELRDYLQHRLNPAHVYCRLREFGLGKSKARRMVTYYSKFYSFTWLG